MGRLHNDLKAASCLFLCTAQASCSTEPEPLSTCAHGVYSLCPTLIESSPMYSAYDGVHAYSVTPWIPAAVPHVADSDPVLASSVRWAFDQTFVTASAFPELAGGIKLTTKRAGSTSIEVTCSTVSGAVFRQRAALHVAEADSSDWDIGNARYERGELADWAALPMNAPPGEGTCGLPLVIEFPRTAACTSCHDGRDSMSAEYTPTQFARYSDDQLIDIVKHGAKPAGDTFESSFLRELQMPDCVFANFHNWSLSEPEEQGIVLKLRSITPHAID